jgi:4,5-dihydroxyphthalate decarboxylase
LALSAAIGDYPHTAALKAGRVASDLVLLDFVSVTPIHRAFAPMARERRYDVCEMAIATFLQAKAFGVALTLLPIALAARFQEQALLCRKTSALPGPADLAGRRIGVRAYSQTTGLWLRGILLEDYGLRPQDSRWVTFESAHVLGYADPPFVERAAPGKEMLAMLRDGELDAVIAGNEAPNDSDLRAVFPDPPAAAEVFAVKHGFMPINHVVVVKSEIAEGAPEIARELSRMFRASKAQGPPASGAFDRAPTGREAIAPSVDMAMRLALAQELLPRPLDAEEVWRGVAG